MVPHGVWHFLPLTIVRGRFPSTVRQGTITKWPGASASSPILMRCYVSDRLRIVYTMAEFPRSPPHPYRASTEKLLSRI